MVTEEEKDVIGEVIAEDAAMRCAVIGVQNVNSAMSTIDELRQQLADVSHERDLLRASVTELQGLLNESLPALDQAASAFKRCKPTRDRVRAALSKQAGSEKP